MKTARTFLLLLAATGLCLAQALPPIITGINPSSVTAGSPVFTLTVGGQYFVSGSQVLWNGSALAGCIYNANANTLTCPVPALLVASPGAATIQVINQVVGYPSQSSNTVTFIIIAPPTISAITPTAVTAGCTGVVLTIVGTGFLPGGEQGSQVQWSGPTASGRLLRPEFITDGELRLAIPDNFLTTAGTATVYVVNPGGVYSNGGSLTINPPLVITTTSLPNGTVGVDYSTSLAASGGTRPFLWYILGDLPPGLAFSASTLVIRGTPTAAGTFSFTVRVTDDGKATASRTFTVTIIRGVTITTESLPTGTVGVAYSANLAATGGATPYIWSIFAGVLPPGLSISASTGAVTGAPTAAGTFNVTAQVTDSAKSTATKAFTLTINPAALVITTASPLPGSTVGVSYSQTLTATGGVTPYNWSLVSGSLPAGLSLNASTGVISGTPTAPGTFNFTAQVTDGAKSTATKAFAVTISPAALAITTASPLPGGTVGASYSQSLAATGGVTPYYWSITSGALPPGLALGASTGAIAGTPTAPGAFSFNAQVTDSARSAAAKPFTLTVTGLPALTFAGLTDVVQPAQQPRLQVNLAAGAPAALSGRLTLSFRADAVVPADDPALQFAGGGRTVDFTIPAGSTRAQFGSAQDVGVQVGTVAGTITVTASLRAGEVDVTPSPAPSFATRVNRAAPVISTVRVTRTTAGFEVEIIGYATPRQVTSATFRFTASGADLTTPEIPVNVDSAFTTWYQNAASASFGSQFRYVQPFTVSGEASAVNAVRVTLTNATGTSQEASATF